MTSSDISAPQTDFERLTGTFEKLGIEFVVRSRLSSTGSGRTIQFVFIKKYEGYLNGQESMVTASLETLMNRNLHFFEFCDGELASY